MFDLVSIHDLSGRYRKILDAELIAIQNLTSARSALESEKNRVIWEAKERSEIDMKNADTRRDGENKAVENSNGCYWLDRYVQSAQQSADQVEIERKIIETELSLIKAWLYSQSGK